MKRAFYDTRAVDEQDEDLGPSKSQKKRDSEAMQKLGQELARLPADQFERIDLPEDIREAIVEYQRMKSFGAMRRQMQLIGKRRSMLKYIKNRDIEEYRSLIKKLGIRDNI